MQFATIGLDLAKHVFQVHGVDADGKVVVRKQLRRSGVIAFFEKLPSYLVGIEACAWAHYWARELCTLGHTVRLMPAKDVKAYVKGNKNDATEARDERLPADARASLAVLVAQIEACQEQIGTLDKRIHTQHRANEASCRLETIPGIGVIGATAIEATLSNSAVFASGRDFAAWIGLVPR